VDEAKRLGFTALGLSEHCPLPDHKYSSSRMEFHQLEDYMEECRALQQENSSLEILCGFECDHHSDYESWYKETLIESRFADYLIFGVHYLDDSYLSHLPPTKKMLHAYTNLYLEGLQSGLYHVGVHPDLFGNFYVEWDSETEACSRAIMECAVENNIPLEINAHGFRKRMISTSKGKRYQYPQKNFWLLAKEYDVKVVINSDAHAPSHLDLANNGSYPLAEEIGLTLSNWYIGTSSNGEKILEVEK